MVSADVKTTEELVETRLIVKLIGGKNYLSEQSNSIGYII